MVFASGVGGEILAPMALPVLGGLLIADEVVDIFLPVRFYWVRRARWLKLHGKSLAQTLDVGPLPSTHEASSFRANQGAGVQAAVPLSPTLPGSTGAPP